jgi:Zn-dependent metalloprotease
MDGKGKQVRIRANYVDGDAYYTWQAGFDYLYFGQINGQHLITADIVGHEFSHGIIFHTAELDNKNEPGTLDESYADIFGFMIELFIEQGMNRPLDWTIGEDANIPYDFMRNLSAPYPSGEVHIAGLK